jgi:PAS domain S-box-containing protein
MLDDILITKELSKRSPRLPNWQAEAQAMQPLARMMAQGADLLPTLVEIALELCQAGTVGVRLLETSPDGEEIFRWVVLAGTLVQYVGGSTPGNFSPCKVCLEHGTPQLFSHPERYYTYFQAANTPIVEDLVLPLIADSHVFGTISIMSHDENRHFDLEDVRVMTSLADFAVANLLMKQRQIQELLTKDAQLEAEAIKHNRSHKALRESEEYLRAMIENLPGGAAFVVDRNLRYLLAEGEALSAAGFKPEDFVGHTLSEALPPELVPSYEALYRKSLAGESFESEHNSHDRFYISRGTPLRSSDGEVYAVLAVSYDITERKQAEEALRESEEKYRALFNSIDQGYFLCDVIFDENNLPIDIFYLDTNSAATRMVGSDFRGKRLSEISPDYESYWYEIFGRVAQTGEGTRLEQYAEPDQKWYDFYVFKIGEPDSRRVAVVFQDISDRKRRDANQAFLAEITDEMSRLLTTEEIMETVGAKIGAYLKVKSCLFVDVDDVRGEVTVFDAWNTADVPSLRYQTIRLADFINEEFARANRSGESVVVRDTRTDPRGEGKDYTVVGIGAFVTVPFHRNGVWTNYLAVTDSQSHDWRDDEIELFRELSNRIFPRLDRAHAEAALRESEAQLQKAFSAETVGVLFFSLDGGIQDANETFTGMSGYTQDELQNAVHWETLTPPEFRDVTVQAAAELAEKGETAPYEKQLFRKGGSRWWGLFAPTRLSGRGLESQCVEFIIDITERKQAEEALRESKALIAADLVGMRRLYELQSKLVNQNDVKAALQEVLAVACDFTGTDRGCVQLLSSDGERLEMFVWQGYADDSPFISFFRYEGLKTGCEVARVHRQRMIIEDTVGFPSLEGTDAGAAAHADGIRASQSTPMASRKGETIGVISTQFRQPHRSSDHALRLVDMLAWTAGEFLERHRADAALRQSEEKYRSLFEAINDGFCLIEMIFDENEKPVDYRFLEISPSFERQTGMTNAIGKRMRELAPNHEEYWFETYGNVALTGQAVRFEHRAEQFDRWFDVYAFPDGEPENRQVAIVFNNITERKQAEENRIQLIQEQAAREEERQRAEALAEVDRAKTIFFSNVSHEFRTPLTLLLSPLQETLSDRTSPLAPPQWEQLELAHRNALRLLKLVNNLLDFSRIEAERMEAVYEPTDLAMLTTELASVFRSTIERAGLRLVVDCPPLSEPVYVDPQMWEKIVLNLLSNAFKFTFAGKIAVRLHPTDGNRVILQIQDTGTGIAPEHLPHLFERFYQVRGAKGRAHEGSGIGLTLVNELIRLHGGTINVSSTVGQGSCFTIALPLGCDCLPSDRLRRLVGDRIKATRTLSSVVLGAAPYIAEVERWLPAQGGDKGESSALSLASPARVLLVDDNADMRDYLTRILSQYVQVEAVADGEAALAAAGERVPDLVLTDVMMPGLDGFGLLQALRADSRTREVPIILLSACAGKEAVIEGLQAGADDYLIKPFSALELVSRVKGHLQMTQMRSVALQQERTTSKRKDELLSIVSHELNTPLVSILGWTRLLRSVPPSPAMLMKSLDTIERNAELQAKLIADLLDISRITSGKLRLNLEPVKLESVVTCVIATVSQTAPAKGINLIWQPTIAPSDTDSLVVMGDRDRLQQVICNLLTNAIKFTPESGSVTIELLVVDDRNSPHASYAQMRVVDTGIGIAADFLPHVFDRFRQAESGSTKGLGLGLAIAHHLVELHNGTIHAESPGVGQGATFTVKLPLVEP